VEGHHIVCGYGDGSLQIYSAFDWTFQYRIPNAHDAAITALLQLPNGILVTAACDGVFKVWERFSFGPFKCIAAVVAHSDSIEALTITGGNRLVTGCVDGKMKQWNIGSWDRHITMASKTRFMYVLQQCYIYIVSGGSDGLLKVWDRVTGLPIGAYVGHIGCYAAGVAVSSGTLVSVGSDDRKVKVHDITPWLIAAIDCVDMFQVWRVLKGPSTNPLKADVALYNLIQHFRHRPDVSFVEHFLTLGFQLSPENLQHLVDTKAHERFNFYKYLDNDRDGVITEEDIVNRSVQNGCDDAFVHWHSHAFTRRDHDPSESTL
jgi:WD40 repeat protein